MDCKYTVSQLLGDFVPGPDLNPIGPCSVSGGPPSHKFSDINVQKHSVDACELYAILLLLSELRVETRLSAF